MASTVPLLTSDEAQEEDSTSSIPVSKRVIDVLMRKKKLWLTFVFCLISVSLFYFSIVRIEFHKPFILATPLILQTTLTEIDVHDLKSVLPEERNNGCPIGQPLYEEHCSLTPFLETHKDVRDLGSVTLSTQGTVEFLHHIAVLCKRWGGPISVAVFSPEEDYVDARYLVDELRECDFCIRHWVSWHFFFRKQNLPLYEPASATANCSYINQRNVTKRRSEGPYPINVGRNLARSKTRTPYVFSIDIELYPSPGIPSKFERMLLTKTVDQQPQVWVIPVFEVHSKFTAPVTKFALKYMYAKKQVISFHKYRCDMCHKIPNLTEWFNQDASMKSEVNESLEELKIFSTVLRSRKYNRHMWEPFFIGTKNDPEFDIRLSWEGKQNKMQVAYEMCLRKYDFHIVSNAFLVHSPGINVYNASKERNRIKYLAENRKWFSVITKELNKKYGTNKDC